MRGELVPEFMHDSLMLCSVQCLTLAIEACFMRAFNGVESALLNSFIDNVKLMAKMQMGSTLSDYIGKIIEQKETITLAVSSFMREHAEQELFPFAVHGFTDSADRPFVFTENEDEIRSIIKSVEWRRSSFHLCSFLLDIQ
jgi:hypothetical protein